MSKSRGIVFQEEGGQFTGTEWETCFLFLIFFIEVQLNYHVVLVSDVQQSDSVMCIDIIYIMYIYSLFSDSFPVWVEVLNISRTLMVIYFILNVYVSPNFLVYPHTFPLYL